jgi:hypothetical protein
VIQGFHVPTVTSWSYVISHYPASLWSLVRQDAYYPMTLSYTAVWYLVGAALLIAVAYMFIAGPRRDPFFMLCRAGSIGALALVAILITYTDLRLELVFVPGVAAALAFAVTRLPAAARVWTSRGLSANAAALEPDRP